MLQSIAQGICPPPLLISMESAAVIQSGCENQDGLLNVNSPPPSRFFYLCKHPMHAVLTFDFRYFGRFFFLTGFSNPKKKNDRPIAGEAPPARCLLFGTHSFSGRYLGTVPEAISGTSTWPPQRQSRAGRRRWIRMGSNDRLRLPSPSRTPTRARSPT